MGFDHQALRKGRRSLPGQVYLVTFCTLGRKTRFRNWEMASETARLVAGSPAWRHSRVLAWVLVLNHWHGLVVLGEYDTLARCISRLKGTTARQLRLQFPGTGALWARSYQDRALRRHDDVRRAARYLVMNPVRAGLVQRVGDYPFWDATWLHDDTPV